MITSNVIQRTFPLRFGEGEATCFIADVDDREYLVTAKHVVEGIRSTGNVQLFHEGSWKELDVLVVGLGDREIDVAVLAPSHSLSPRSQLWLSMEGIAVGQDVYFLGFPYGFKSRFEDINRGFPVPFIKKGILSALGNDMNGRGDFYLDGHNNPGFSGGPVVYERCGGIPPNRAGKKVIREYRVAGVVSGYYSNAEPIYDGDDETFLRYRENTGIVTCFSAAKALEIIEGNPVGLLIEDAVNP